MIRLYPNRPNCASAHGDGRFYFGATVLRTSKAIFLILAIVIIAYGITLPFMPSDHITSIGTAILVLVATGLIYIAYRALLKKADSRDGTGGNKIRESLRSEIELPGWLKSFRDASTEIEQIGPEALEDISATSTDETPVLTESTRMVGKDYGAISTSIDVLDAALRVHLAELKTLDENTEPHSFDYERTELGTALIVYKLKYTPHGVFVSDFDAGEVRLRKLGAGQTNMTIVEPPQFLKARHDDAEQFLFFRLTQDGVLPRSQPEKIEHGKANKQPPSPRSTMNTETKGKLKKLLQKRDQSIKNGIVTISWSVGCDRAGIRPETASRHASKLQERWSDADYHPEITEFI